MIGRGGIFVRGKGERGRGRDGRGRGGNTSTITSRKKILCAALGENIFTYSEKGAAEQLSITLHQIVKHIRFCLWTRNQQRDTTKQRLLLSRRFMIKNF